MATTTETTCRPDEAFAETIAAALKPMIAERVREVVQGIVAKLDFDEIAQAVLDKEEFSGDLGTAIAQEVNRYLCEEVLTDCSNLPDGCEF